MFGEQANRPFIGWLMLVEDAAGSRSPVTERSPHFPVRPEFQNASYLSAFPDHRSFCRCVVSIAWETHVWIAEAPEHMIHFSSHPRLAACVRAA